jgi:hypothetical protein
MRSFQWVVHAKSFAILGARETSDFLLSVVCHFVSRVAIVFDP